MQLHRCARILLGLVITALHARSSPPQDDSTPKPPVPAVWFGGRVALLADVDEDHVSELVVGAPRAEGGCGALHVVSGATGKLLWHVVGASPQAELGSVFATGGDVDGDGVEDVVVREQKGASARVEVLSGKDGRRLGRIEHASVTFVDQLLVVPDLDGDHAADVLIVERSSARMLAVSGRGRTTLHAGPSLSAMVLATLRRRANLILCALGQDVDGDGVADFACSYEVEDEEYPPKLRSTWLAILSGRAGYVVREACLRDRRIDSPCLSSGRDVDGDGARDLLLSSADDVVELVSSATLRPVRSLWKGPSVPDLEGFGASSAFVGDLDGDGASEVLVGCSDTLFPGGDYRAALYSGRGAFAGCVETTTYAHTRVFAGADFDRDGLPELVIGLPEIDEVWIIDGRSTRPFAKDVHDAGPRWWCQRVLTPKGAYVPAPK
ncbi:MAG: hypothetical protein IPJ77_09625 [Planctomycetes bacterium]|nr:hypothetical protein [Planctomycetota bacterium]